MTASPRTIVALVALPLLLAARPTPAGELARGPVAPEAPQALASWKTGRGVAPRSRTPEAAAVSSLLFVLGTASVEVDQRSGSLRVRVDEVNNASEFYSSGETYIDVWASPSFLYYPEAIPADSWLIASVQLLSGLSPRQSYLDLDSGWIAYQAPPNGPWNVLLSLAERFPDTGTVDPVDYRNGGISVFGTAAEMTGGRVSVSATWRNPYSGQTGTALPTFPQNGQFSFNDEFAFFYFSDPANPEIFVKVLGANNPDYIQLFVGGTTDFEYGVSFQGCGRILQFSKAAYTTGGYVNGAAIPKSGCR